jgi:arylformamidase
MTDPPRGRIVDISVGIHPAMLTWPSDPDVEVQPVSRVAAGDTASVSNLKFGSHTGTHVDPPFHFLEHGSTVDELSLDVLVGPAVVADLTGSDGEVDASDLEGLDLGEGVVRLLLKTKNSSIWQQSSPPFPDNYVSVSADGAQWLVSRGIQLVGTDFLSIERRGAPGHPTHVTLLEAGVVIVEGLDLREVEAGDYTLICLPLKIIDGDGAPARAILVGDRNG